MKSSCFLLTVCTLLAAFSASAATFFVATNGNDSWSGRLEKPSGNATDGPFVTLPRAVNAARAARLAKPSDPVTIFLRGGTHELSEPITLTVEDSGADASRPFTIAAYQNEKPVI